MAWEQWVALAALVLAALAVVVGATAWHGVRKRAPRGYGDDADESGERPSPRPPAVVVNPARIADMDHLHRIVARTAAEAGLPAPLWFETTVEDPGVGQARAALDEDPSVVIAVGGDGTVRAVAGAMAGSGVPMGVVPLGTGNLFARNLDLPMGSLRETVATALTGRERPMDLGWLSTEPLSPDPDKLAKSPDDEPPVEHPFVVIGGLGFDAAMVEGADDQLKARLGWAAYFVAGARHLRGRRIRATAELGDAEPVGPFTARTILVANCGRLPGLPGGIVLFPDAQLDDGWLDIGVIDTSSGLFGWASLLRKVLLQGVGIRQDLAPYRVSTLDFRRARSVTIRTEEPESVQVDGDLIGHARVIHARVEEHALIIRMP